MKKIFKLFYVVSLLVVFALFYGCKKEEIPTLTTAAVSGITTVAASTGGNVTDDGGADVTARGVCWGTATKPTITGSKTSDGTGPGSFTSSLTGLTANTSYFVRAYATNSQGTAYGNEVTFKTEAIVGATVTTAAVTVFAQTTATAGGNVTSDGGAEVTERGVYFGTTSNPSTGGTKVAAASAGTGVFTCSLTSLTPGTLYYVMAYATNTSGTTYGTAVQFTTSALAPTVTTTAVSVFTQTTATAGGNVTSDGGAAITERGVYYGTAANPATTGTKITATPAAVGAFTCSLTSLTPGTKYYVVAFATNSVGPAYGTVVEFTTGTITLATLTTTAATAITNTTATSGGTITSNGGGAITTSGVCWGTSPNPTTAGSHTTDGTPTGSFTSSITGLSDGTVYYVRAYATNSAGPAYGTQVQLLTKMVDVDNHLYNTVLIGNQVWMAENLKTTKLSDETAIHKVVGNTPAANTEWAGMTGPAFCYYQDNNDYGDTYGALYNYYTINTGLLCPAGWSVPTDAQFKTLEMHLGMSQAEADGVYDRGTHNEGLALKSATGWNPGGIEGTNASGFTGLPGGYRFWQTGECLGLGGYGSWGTSTGHSASTYIYRQLRSDLSTVYRVDTGMAAGFSVRCIKN
jgi:uncharacterized protein (TIGR02145 family)